MDKNIVALLNSNLRVIIPDFGAFIIRQQDPKIIVFNEFLRYNDGFLVDYIIKTEGSDMEMARQQLIEYTGHAVKVLETGDVFAIEGLGSLQRDKSGKTTFTPENEIKPSEIQKSSNDEPVIQLIEEIIPNKPKTKRTPKSVSVVTPEVTAPEVTAPEVTASEVSTPVVVAPVEVLASPEGKPGPEAKTPDEKQPVDAPLPAEHLERSYKKLVNRPRQLLRWTIIILLANIAIFAWFIFRDDIRNLFTSNPEPEIVTDSVFRILADSVKDAAADTTLVFSEANESGDIGVNAAVQGNLRYYIVAGCFRDEVNADDLVKSLKSKGFKAEKFGKIGNLYAVCFASFDDKEMAVKELKHIREEIHPDAWMTRF